MSNELKSWLDCVPEFHGLLAAGVTVSHQPLDIRTWSDTIDKESVHAIYQQIHDAVEVLEAGKNPSQKLRWIFEQAIVYFEKRSDEAGLFLITTHEPWLGESDTISNVISNFRLMR